jgi:hypothetical protein
MKKFLRWLLYIFIALVVLVVIAVLSIDPIVKKIAEKRIRTETGMIAEIGKFHIGFFDQSLTVTDFKLLNPPEFGGGTLVELPELHVQYDVEAMRSNIVHLRFVKIDMSHLHIVENKDGKRNVDILVKQPSKKHGGKKSPSASTNAPPQLPALPFQFGGIDKLQVTLGETKYSSDKFPDRSFDRNLGIKNEVFKDIKNEQDLETVGIVIALKAGIANLFQEKLF